MVEFQVVLTANPASLDGQKKVVFMEKYIFSKFIPYTHSCFFFIININNNPAKRPIRPKFPKSEGKRK
jgi:hypothetical protein